MVFMLILMMIITIAPGIFIYDAASDVVYNTDSLDAVEIEAFNQQFTIYEGDRVDSTNVKALLAKCITNAGTYSDSDERLPDILYLDVEGIGPEVDEEFRNIISDSENNQITNINIYKI